MQVAGKRQHKFNYYVNIMIISQTVVFGQTLITCMQIRFAGVRPAVMGYLSCAIRWVGDAAMFRLAYK